MACNSIWYGIKLGCEVQCLVECVESSVCDRYFASSGVIRDQCGSKGSHLARGQHSVFVVARGQPTLSCSFSLRGEPPLSSLHNFRDCQRRSAREMLDRGQIDPAGVSLAIFLHAYIHIYIYIPCRYEISQSRIVRFETNERQSCLNSNVE